MHNIKKIEEEGGGGGLKTQSESRYNYLFRNTPYIIIK